MYRYLFFSLAGYRKALHPSTYLDFGSNYLGRRMAFGVVSFQSPTVEGIGLLGMRQINEGDRQEGASSLPLPALAVASSSDRFVPSLKSMPSAPTRYC